MAVAPGLRGGPPAVIAHRGASGYLPEHTLAGKAYAHAAGADYLEQDVVGTRDSALIVFHDVYLDDLTDVAVRFPGRARPDGRHYCIDFDLEEIRSLALTERRRAGTREPRFPGRFPASGGAFGIPTLDEELAFIGGLNRSTGRVAGIYPEIKDPAWHRGHGIDLSALVVAALARHGYRTADDPVFLQCFDPVELARVRGDLGCRLRLVQLLEGGGSPPDARSVARIAEYADGLGPSMDLLVSAPDGAGRARETGLVGLAHEAGLAVHPYTFRRDALPAGFRDFSQLLGLFLDELKVDGLFTDFPDLVVRYLRARS